MSQLTSVDGEVGRPSSHPWGNGRPWRRGNGPVLRCRPMVGHGIRAWRRVGVGEVVAEPGGGQGGHPVQGPGLVEQVAGPTDDLQGAGAAQPVRAWRLTSSTGWSRPPTISRVGARTAAEPGRPGRAGRRGRRPRRTWSPSSAAAHRRRRRRCWPRSTRRAGRGFRAGRQPAGGPVSRPASRPMSKQLARSASSAAVSRSTSRVASRLCEDRASGGCGGCGGCCRAVGDHHDPHRVQRHCQVAGELDRAEVDDAFARGVVAGRGRIGGRRRPGGGQQPGDVLVAGLGEVAIELADGQERPGSGQGDQLSATPESALTVSGGATGTARSSVRPPAAKHRDGGPGGGAGGDPSSTTTTVRPPTGSAGRPPR